MTENELDEFNDSLSRCQKNEKVIDRFYEIFLGSAEEVRQKFSRTDFRKQQRMLKASFLMLMLVADGKPEGRVHLERIAGVHSKAEHDIPPHLYDLWLRCLLQAVKECDPRFSPEIERAWRQVMENGIAYMKRHYDRPPHTG